MHQEAVREDIVKPGQKSALEKMGHTSLNRETYGFQLQDQNEADLEGIDLQRPKGGSRKSGN